MSLELRPIDACEFDVVSLGEVMLRLDPGEGRIRTARSFRVWEGGGEYNVARGLRKVFGLRAAVVTSLADNEVGHLVEDLILQGGVDTSLVKWVPFDGIGRTTRNGINFTERGFGIRGAVGVSDRAGTAISQLDANDIDWDDLFGRRGVRWLHTGGIFAGLSATTHAVADEAMRSARAHGTIVSFDLNYRPSLWAGIGGQSAAREVNHRLAGLVDVMIGNEEDFTAALGFDVPDVSDDLSDLPVEKFSMMIDNVAKEMPWLSVVATTMRTVRSASINDWRAIAWSPETGVLCSQNRPGLEILDRVGGGDSFASGLVYGLQSGGGLQRALDLGAAHGALAMTTPGDTSMATFADVVGLVEGAGARVRR